MVAASKWMTYQFTIVLAVVQVALLIAFCLLTTHTKFALPGGIPISSHQVNYTDFQDIHLVLIVGFGFLVVFLRRYGFGSFSVSLLLTAVTIQWALIFRGVISDEFKNNSKFDINLSNLVSADFTAAVVLISFGAVVGKLSPTQYLVLAILEVPASVVSERIIVNMLQVQDIGGAVVVHVFSAVFGAVVSRVLFKKQWQQSDDVSSVYHSEVISFVGAAFLWVFLPSLNAVGAIGDARQRAIVNSYVALSASTVAAFLASQLINKTHHFNIRHIVSASLAGGVALGASANLLLVPVHAAIIGVVAGLASIVGFQIITPLLNFKLGVHDTRGVISVHGIPGVIGSVASAIVFIVYPENSFPVTSNIIATDRSSGSQGVTQLLGLLISVAIAVITAAITGFILKLKIWTTVSDAEIFSDTNYFDVPEDYEFTTRVISHIDSVQLREPSIVVQPSSPSKEVVPVAGEESQQLVPAVDVPTVIETPANDNASTSFTSSNHHH